MTGNRFFAGQVFCLVLFFFNNTAQGASSGYRDGMAAFKQGDFSSALEAFQRHRKHQGSSPQLLYNLGVCHYKLGQYEPAREAFENLAEQPGWQALAYLNLAIIAEATGDTGRAVNRYREVIALAPDSRPAQAAERGLARLTGNAVRAAGTSDIKAFSGTASVALGYDDNPYSLDEQVADAAGSDTFTDLLLAANGSFSQAFGFEAWFFTRQYQEFSTLDFTGIHGKLDYRQTLDYLPAQPAISVTRLYLDGNDYSTDFTGHLRFADVFGEDNLTVSLEAAHISGGADYSYLDGFRLRAMTAKIWLGDGYRFTLDYRLQYDQRDDLREDDIRIIESGREQRIRAELAFTVGSRTDLSLFGHYRHARKDDDSRLQDLDGSVRQLTRTTTGFTAGVEADYQLHRAATLSAEARYESTDDSYELYRHDRLTLTVSASYRF